MFFWWKNLLVLGACQASVFELRAIVGEVGDESVRLRRKDYNFGDWTQLT
jgi:hypothetical protein